MTATLGVDPHKASHTVVATDPIGRQLAQTTSQGTRTSDHQQLIGWARQRWPERTWAMEDRRHVAGRLLADLPAPRRPRPDRTRPACRSVAGPRTSRLT